ncbi:MAG: sensor histidine kinase, partial [Janthinobacterium lividum]
QQVLQTLVPREREVAVAAGGASYLMQVRPYKDLNNVIDGTVVSFVDISERKKHEQARSRLAAIVESSQDAIIAHSLDGLVTSWNDGARRLLGASTREAVGQPMPALVRDALPWDWADMLRKLQHGEQLPLFECAGTTKNGELIEVSVTVSPILEGSGRIAGVSLVARDISARRMAEQKAALLLGELDHRVKNILAIVSAVISQTLKTTPTPEAFATEVNGRVQAIAKAHSLLTQSGHGEVSLRAILRIELAPYDRGTGNVSVTGQDVALTPKAGLALAMAVHELASNAAKYGALSITSGRLTIAWDILPGAGAPALTLTWTETGGPAVSPPTRRGFGTTLIERALTHEIDAEVSREFLAGGLLCTIAVPLTEEVGRPQPDGSGGETS